MTNPIEITIVAAMILRDERILLVQSRGDQNFPFTWGCPGGKVDPGETQHDALRRELHEELGVTSSPIWPSGLRPIWQDNFHMQLRKGDVRADFHIYDVHLIGEPKPQEGQGIGWFTSVEMGRLSLSPGNLRAMSALMVAMLRTRKL